MTQTAALLAEVRDAISDLRSTKQSGIDALPKGVSPEHIDWCIDHFSQIESHILSGRLPSAEGRKSTFSRMYTDSWPWDWPLGKKLAAVENNYRYAES